MASITGILSTWLKVLAIVLCLLVFICSLDLLSASFKLLLGKQMGKLLLEGFKKGFKMVKQVKKIYKLNSLQTIFSILRMKTAF